MSAIQTIRWLIDYTNSLFRNHLILEHQEIALV